MKYLFEIFIFSILLSSTSVLGAQVSGVQYGISYNTETFNLDCYLYISEGSAFSVRDRVQFNSQFSLLIPSDIKVDLASSYMPLVDNQNFLGSVPLQWGITSKIVSPESMPDFSFYAVTPTLAPAGFYNNLEEGDVLKLFSLNVEGNPQDINKIRIYDNNHDPKSHDAGMLNGDFTNGFTIGGFQQVYKGIKLINKDEINYASSENEK